MESTFTKGPGYCQVRGYSGFPPGLFYSAPTRPLWLPKTLRYIIQLDSLFFYVNTKGDLGPIGLRWKPGTSAVSVLTVVRSMCSLRQRKQMNVTLWGCSFPVLSVCMWLNFWGSLTSLPINPGFMRQTENPKNLDLEVLSQTSSPPSFRSFYACSFKIQCPVFKLHTVGRRKLGVFTQNIYFFEVQYYYYLRSCFTLIKLYKYSCTLKCLSF